MNKIKDIVDQYNSKDECNTITFVNSYGKEPYVELHAFNYDGVYLQGEFNAADLEVLSKALKRINKI